MKKPPKLTQKTLLRYAIQGVVLGVLATTAVVFFTTEADTIEQLRNFRWQLGILLFFIVFIAWICNGFRVMILSRSLGYPLQYKQSIAVSLSSEFGIAATPAGMGGAVIRLALLRRAGIPLAHGTSMLATDVTLDIMFFLMLFPFAVYSIIQNPKILALFTNIDLRDWQMILLILLGIVVVISFIVRFHFLQKFYKRIIQWTLLGRYRIPARMRLLNWKIKGGWRQTKEGVQHLFGMRKSAVLLTFLMASIQWTCRYSILPITLYALSIPNDPILLFMLQGILFMASLLFVLPGGGGGVELSTALILQLIIPHAVIGIVILIWRLFTYHLYLLGGGITFFITGSRLNTLFPQKPPAYEEEEITFDENNEHSD